MNPIVSTLLGGAWSGIALGFVTAAGEQVQRGQELVRMLDCRAAVVTAVVSESVYNRLQVGTVANFRFRDSDVEIIDSISTPRKITPAAKSIVNPAGGSEPVTRHAM